MKTNNQFQQTPLCHSLTNVSEEIRNLDKMPYLADAQGMTEESGRSMVEMLGVLAVIGVLSVTGVAGYQRAMTKHRANELLNEAGKRAVVVATQISAGKTASISEFNNTNIAGLGVGFDSTIGRDGDKLFSIKTDGNIAKEICQQVYNAIGDKTAVRLLQSGTVDVTSADKCAASAPLSFTYNNELSSEGLGYDGHFDPDDGTKCAEGYYPAGKCNLQCTGNTKVNAAGTGCDCKTGYKGTDCNECDDGYRKNGALCEPVPCSEDHRWCRTQQECIARNTQSSDVHFQWIKSPIDGTYSCCMSGIGFDEVLMLQRCCDENYGQWMAGKNRCCSSSEFNITQDCCDPGFGIWHNGTCCAASDGVLMGFDANGDNPDCMP